MSGFNLLTKSSKELESSWTHYWIFNAELEISAKELRDYTERHLAESAGSGVPGCIFHHSPIVLSDCARRFDRIVVISQYGGLDI